MSQGICFKDALCMGPGSWPGTKAECEMEVGQGRPWEMSNMEEGTELGSPGSGKRSSRGRSSEVKRKGAPKEKEPTRPEAGKPGPGWIVWSGPGHGQGTLCRANDSSRVGGQVGRLGDAWGLQEDSKDLSSISCSPHFTWLWVSSSLSLSPHTALVLSVTLSLGLHFLYLTLLSCLLKYFFLGWRSGSNVRLLA